MEIRMDKSFDIFISHSSKDKELSNSLCQYLEERGLRCWIAPRNILIGKDYGQSIIEGIQSSKVMIIIFSKFANESSFVKSEVERAFHYKLHLLPFKIDSILPEKKFELFLSSAHWLEATTNKPEYYFENLFTSCSSLLGTNTSAPDHEDHKKKSNIFSGIFQISRLRKKHIIAVFATVTLLVASFLVVPKTSSNSPKKRGLISDSAFTDSIADSIAMKHGDTLTSYKFAPWYEQYKEEEAKMRNAQKKGEWDSAKLFASKAMMLLRSEALTEKEYIQKEIREITTRQQNTNKENPEQSIDARKVASVNQVKNGDYLFEQGEQGWKSARDHYIKANELIAGSGNSGYIKFLNLANEIYRLDSKDEAGVVRLLKKYAEDIKNTRPK